MHVFRLEAAGRDRAELARLITSAGADLVCVHGAPAGFRWRQACADLARRSGLVVVAGGRAGGGVLVLSTLGVDVDAVQELRFGTRPLAGTVLAALRHRGTRFVLAAADLAADDQVAQLTAAAGSFVPGGDPILYAVRGAHRDGWLPEGISEPAVP